LVIARSRSFKIKRRQNYLQVSIISVINKNQIGTAINRQSYKTRFIDYWGKSFTFKAHKNIFNYKFIFI